MAWIYLFAAGLFEVVWAYFMKESEGFSRLAPSAVTITAMVASVALLSVAMRTIPLGTAYVVWTGIGALGTFAVGIVAYGETMSAARMAAAAIILSGLVMMSKRRPHATFLRAGSWAYAQGRSSSMRFCGWPLTMRVMTSAR